MSRKLGAIQSKQFDRIKPWILDADSNKPISNRLKGEEVKLVIDDPHFVFMGMSVRETWKLNVDAASMLDGFCQRFNYVIAPARQDTDMFDHFLYFRGDHIPAVQAKLRRCGAALKLLTFKNSAAFFGCMLEKLS